MVKLPAAVHFEMSTFSPRPATLVEQLAQQWLLLGVKVILVRPQLVNHAYLGPSYDSDEVRLFSLRARLWKSKRLAVRSSTLMTLKLSATLLRVLLQMVWLSDGIRGD